MPNMNRLWVACLTPQIALMIPHARPWGSGQADGWRTCFSYCCLIAL
jgi:hypothetical protein